MKPDKFDILKSVIKLQYEKRGTYSATQIHTSIMIAQQVYHNYDESLTIEQNIEKHLS